MRKSTFGRVRWVYCTSVRAVLQLGQMDPLADDQMVGQAEVDEHNALMELLCGNSAVQSSVDQSKVEGPQLDGGIMSKTADDIADTFV